ncbi:hypothetical protein BX666DRAFT_2109183 [Dichotomocladium elegans]|nr:hypothetical protein BX666DRAFT_2109183 [Dichotomocladium elegans]
MLESLVATILNRSLGSYVSNLNYDQLNIGVWKGEANLRDLKLRREALDKLKLPIDVVEGYLGELKLIIPWSNLKKEPVKVYIDNVYLLAVPKSEATLSLDEEEKRAQQLKERRLATAELLSTKGLDQQQPDESSNDGFISQLTTKVVDNLQVSIKNIHIRFEDSISDPGHPYSAGITLKELSAVSTDGQWNPTFISETTNTIHKLVTLHSLSIYWNTDSESLAGLPRDRAAQAYADLIPDGDGSCLTHQYILKPVSGTGKVKLNKHFGSGTPKTDVALFFDELGVCLDDHQYRDALLLVDLFHINLKKQKYLKFHPGRDVTPRKNPRAYWKFAINAVLSEVHEKNYQWSWDHFKTRRDQRRAYIECFIASKTKKATLDQKEKLNELERILSFEDIRFYRSLAKSKLKRDKIKIEREKKEESQNKGWFSSWWSGSGGSDRKPQSEETDDNTIQITEEQKRELYDAIEYDEAKAAAAMAMDIPKDTIKFNINTKLERGSLTLMKSTQQKSRDDLVSLVFDTVTVHVTQFIESSRIAIGLMDLRLYDSMTPNTLYPQMVGVRKGDSTRKFIMETTGDTTLCSPREDASIHGQEEPLFSVIFDHKPLNSVADNAIQLKTRRLEIVFNPHVIKGVMQFLKPPKSKSESINALLEAAGDTFEGFRQQTMAGLEYALNQHMTLALDIDMDAPIIIIPESCIEPHAPCMIIDAGHICVDSDFANQEIVNEFKNKKLSKEDYARLESLMYDKFNVKLSQTKLLIGSDTQECLEKEKRGDVDQSYVIQRIDMNFTVELCIVQRVSQFTRFKVSGHLPLLSANISDQKYKVLMKMIDVVLSSTSDDEDQIPSITATDRSSTPESSSQAQQQSLFATQWNQHNDLLISDTESDSSAEPYWVTNQRNTASDTASLDVSVSTASAYSKRGHRYQQEQFRFSFIVDKVSATVHEAKANGSEKLLCELVLEKFDFNFVSRAFDMEVNVSLEALNILDKMEHGDEFKYLVTSRTIDDSEQPEKNLVNVRYRQAKRNHPLYQEVYHNFDQTVDIGLSTLNIIVTRSSLLTLYVFILNTFTSPSRAEEHDSDRLPQENTKSMPTAVSSTTIKVNVHMDGLSLILNDDGKRLGTLVLYSGDLSVNLYPKTLKVDGRFSNLTLTDDTVLSIHDQHTRASGVYILSIEGEELLDFSFETFDPKEPEFPGYNSKFYLLMGAFQLKFLDSAKPMLDFLSEFLEMKTVYDAARQAAARQIQETDTRMHFDVTIRSPVIIFPMSDQGDRVTAHLGEIRAANEFTIVSRRKTDDVSADPIELSISRIKCGLFNIGMKSHSVVCRGNKVDRERTLPIIDNLNITVQIESPEKPAPEYGPATAVVGNISDIRMSLTETQYKWLLAIYNTIMTTFLGGSGEVVPVSDDSISIKSRDHQTYSVADQQSRAKEKNAIRQEKPFIQLALSMSLNLVCLDIIAGSDMYSEDWDRQRVARLAFNESSLSMQTWSDNSAVLEAEMRYITFTDTRAESSSQFREIMAPSTTGGPQLQVRLQMPSKADEEQIMNITATVDSPKLVLSLDYVFLLVDFFTKPFAPTKATEAQAFAKSQRERLLGEQQQQQQQKLLPLLPSEDQADKSLSSGSIGKQQPKQQQQGTSKLYFSVNVVDVQVVCLARPETKSSEALILSFNQLTAQQKESLICKLDGIGMILCRMDMPDESAVPFVEKFDVDFSMKTSNTMPRCTVTDITIDVQPLVVRISYQDLMLVIDIINKAIALMGSSNGSNALGARGFDDGSMNDYLDVQSETYLSPLSPGDASATSRNSVNQLQKIEPYIVMSKESLKAQVQGLQFILIEDLHDLPFIDVALQPFTVNTRDWSSSVSMEVFFKVSASSFNFRNSHWEPVIEPWNFGVKASQDSAAKAMNISIQSKDSLFVNVTHAFLETMLTVSGTLVKSQQGFPESAQKQVQPYIIRNQTGHGLRFWNMSDDANYGEPDTGMFALENGQEKSWSFRDWKRRQAMSSPGKNMLGVQVEAFGWESLQRVVLDQEGIHVYRMRPDVDGVSHRLVVDIKLRNHVKQVTFRSGFAVQNLTTERAEMVFMNSKGQSISDVWTIAPSEEFSVPIEYVYNGWMAIRPEGAYEWSQPRIHWSDITHPKGPRVIQCNASEVDQDSYFYQVHGIFDKCDPVTRQYPNMIVQLSAPIEIKNMLPFDIDFAINDKTVGKLFSGAISRGKSQFIHGINSCSHTALSIHVKETRYQPSQFVDIQVSGEDEKLASQSIRVTTAEDDEPLDLLLNVVRLHKAGKGLWISIFAPYLILNKTGLPIVLRSRFNHRQSKHIAYNIESFENADQITPFMFSFPQIDRRNRVELSVNGSKFSDPLSFEAVGNVQDTFLRTTNNAQDMHIGIHVEEGTGEYHLTKIVTIAPRYILKNNLGVDIEFCEFAESQIGGIISKDEKKPLFLLSRSNVRWLCLRRNNQRGIWSAPFDLQQLGDSYVKVENEAENQPILVRISIVLSEASIFVFFEQERRWPYEVINLSSVPVTFYQKASVSEEYKLSNREQKALPGVRKFTLEPTSRMTYSWCMPVANEKQIVLDIYGKERTVNFQAIGTQTPVRYKKQERQSIGRNAGNGILALDVVAVDSALVLRLSDFNPETSLYRPKSSSASTATSSRDGSLRDTFETITVNNVIKYSFGLNLDNIGISIINKRVQVFPTRENIVRESQRWNVYDQEMAYVTVRGFRVNYTDSNQYQSIRAGIQWFQIDNQFHRSTYPILLYPTTLPKNIQDQQTPALHIALDKVKDDAYGVHNFRLFNILLQEMTFEVDEDFLRCVLEFSQFSEYKKEVTAITRDDELFKNEVPEPVLQKVPALYYFQEFCIQPMRLNISFVKTDRINAAEADAEIGRSAFQYAFDIFTMTIGNVNDAPVKLNALLVENMRVSSADLTQRVVLHYREEILFQLHKLLGSVDILGNPVGLFSNLSSGFGELFYEPYQGFIMSDRPQDLGIGIARGVGGFMKKGVFGVTDSMSRFTGSIGKGLSVATMDKGFQDRRRISQTRNKPKHAMYGLTQGVTYFGTSVASGFAGLYKRPMEGIESGGAIGFAEGIGKGLVGVVTKPLVGIFDFASNVTAGVRETTSMFDLSDIGRERLPRYTRPDGIVRPFTQREALGQMWLKDMADGKYFNETYIAHCSTESDEVVVMLSYQYLLIVATRKLEVEASIALDSIELVQTTAQGFSISLKNSSKPVTIGIAEPTSRQWMVDQIEGTLAQRKEEKERR